MNWTDSIKPAADALIASTDKGQVLVSFAALPARAIDEDLMLLNKTGYTIKRLSETEYLISKPKVVRRVDLIQAIAHMLASHNLVTTTENLDD
jgi:hypothetical protein